VLRSTKELRTVLARELRREQRHAGHVQITPAHGLEDLRVPPHRSRGVNPLVGDRFREVQDTLAVDEDGGARLLEKQPSCLDLAEMDEKLGLDGVAALDQGAQTRQELMTGKTAERRCHEVTSKDRRGEVSSKCIAVYFRLCSRRTIASLALDAFDPPIAEKSTRTPTPTATDDVHIAASAMGRSSA
jgi:hypothetical protein